MESQLFALAQILTNTKTIQAAILLCVVEKEAGKGGREGWRKSEKEEEEKEENNGQNTIRKWQHEQQQQITVMMRKKRTVNDYLKTTIFINKTWNASSAITWKQPILSSKHAIISNVPLLLHTHTHTHIDV